MVANHAPRLKRRELPHRQVALLAILIHEGIEEIRAAFPVNDVEQRVQSTVGIPQGKDGIDFLFAFHTVDFLVSATVAAVEVGVEIRRGEAVVHRGIERP